MHDGVIHDAVNVNREYILYVYKYICIWLGAIHFIFLTIETRPFNP